MVGGVVDSLDEQTWFNDTGAMTGWSSRTLPGFTRAASVSMLVDLTSVGVLLMAMLLPSKPWFQWNKSCFIGH